ncbi:MAG: HypC/HybG/HupF family hydrogenase formation chaperone [Candidatus Marinimicrobia bacterium]|nr:HypC/HybG/HupF family hydrogenase formation chaperone [Candidatus Neomarinimicrobiota bacterium]
MCLGIPGKVINIFDENGLKMGNIDYAGTVNKACLEYVSDIQVGQYTVVHAGFGISIIDEDEAMKTYETWEEFVSASAEEGLDIFGNPLEDKN